MQEFSELCDSRIYYSLTLDNYAVWLNNAPPRILKLNNGGYIISCTPNKSLSFSKASFAVMSDFIRNNSFTNKMMTNVNVLSSVMVFGILCHFNGSLVVFVDDSWGIHLSSKIFH